MTEPIDLYLDASRRMSAELMRSYSTSFSLASTLMPQRIRLDIAAIYALVRIADEIVDAVGPQTEESAASRLDGLVADLREARARGYSSNPVLHAYQETAARLAIPAEWEEAFFRSMRADITEPLSLDDYIYGSAEVVGLMCVHAFFGGTPTRDQDAVYAGARGLGRAFQIINFLRDVRADHDDLGRDYLGLFGPDGDASKLFAEAMVRRDLMRARQAIPLLPVRTRAAVAAATGLFAAVETRVETCSLAELTSGRRIHIPSIQKAMIVSATLITIRPRLATRTTTRAGVQ